MQENRLATKLREQLDFIETSCMVFDGGKTHEAIRIGTSLRTLFHEKSRSKSLLRQLVDGKKMRLLTTIPVIPAVSGRITGLTFDPVFTYSLGGAVIDLSVPKDPCYVTVNEWWKQLVLAGGYEGKNIRIDRKTVVLHFVEKEGGAHVDPNITKALELMDRGVMKMFEKYGEKDEIEIPIINSGWALLRRFGFEVMNSPELVALTSSK